MKLEKQLREASQGKESVLRERNSLEGELESVRKEIQVLQKEVGDSKDKLESSRWEYNSLKDQFEAEQYFAQLYKGQVNDLEEEVENRKQAQEALREEKANLVKDLGRVKDEMHNVKTRLEKEAAAKNEVIKRRNDLEKQCTLVELDLRKLKDDSSSELEKRDKELCELREKNASLTSNMSILRKENENNLKSISEKKAKIIELEEMKQKYMTEIQQEKQKTAGLVIKLTDVMEKGSVLMTGKARKDKRVSVETYRQLEKNYKKLENELNRAEGRHQSAMNEMKVKLETLKSNLSDYETEKKRYEDQLNQKEAHIQQLESRIAVLETTDSSNAEMEGKLEISTKGRGRTKLMWEMRFAELRGDRLSIYGSKEDRDTGLAPQFELNLRVVVHVRTVTSVDLIHAKPEDIPRIFQLLYDALQDGRKGSLSDLDEITGNDIVYQGHRFQKLRFRAPTLCEVCNRMCSHMLSPPLALQCASCHIKLHLEHLEQKEKLIPCSNTAKFQFFRVESKEQVNQWIQAFKEAQRRMPRAATMRRDTSFDSGTGSPANGASIRQSRHYRSMGPRSSTLPPVPSKGASESGGSTGNR